MEIEKLTLSELKDKIENNDSIEIVKFKNSHQYTYIIDFFSECLLENGKYISGSKLSDLLQLYYIDFPIKQELAEMALRLERWLNVTILNLHKRGDISTKTGDKQNCFGDKVSLVKELSSDEQTTIFLEMKKIHIFKVPENKKDFIEYIEAAKEIRNFCLHHYSTLSYKYATIIDNGNRHSEKDSKQRILKNDIEKLFRFFTNDKAFKIRRRIFAHVDRFYWSTKEIEKKIKGFYRNLFPDSLINSLSKKKNGSLTHLLEFKNSI